MIKYCVMIICPFDYKVIFEYYCTTKTEAEWLAKTLRKEVTDEYVVMHEIAR